jgi:hypothetical protein
VTPQERVAACLAGRTVYDQCWTFDPAKSKHYVWWIETMGGVFVAQGRAWTKHAMLRDCRAAYLQLTQDATR